jgi:cell division protein FtsL
MGRAVSAIDRPFSRPSFRLWSLRRIIVLAFGAVALLGLLQVIQTSDATSTSYTIRHLEQERLDLSAQVHSLEAEVATLASLERVEREARARLGMVPAENVLYLEVDVPPPQQQLVPRRFSASNPNVDEPGTSWWQALLKLLPFY